MADRLYTVAEANGQLRYIIPILEEAKRLMAEVRSRQQDLERELEAFPTANGHSMQHEMSARLIREDLEVLATRLQEQIQNAERYGCEVKDPETGLIDFRSLREGRVVYLCWRLGERDIGYWHELDAGFRGRQPL